MLLFTISLKLLVENLENKENKENIENKENKENEENMDCPTFLGFLFQYPNIFRKYFTLLIKMINKLCQKSINKKEYNIGKKIHFCYYPCINDMRTKKLYPNEDLINIINQFNKFKIDDNFPEDEQKENKVKNKNPDNMKLYGDQLEEEDLTYENLYTTHNFISDRFIDEKDILLLINESTDDNEDHFEIKLNGEKMIPRIKFNNGIHKIESFYYSQKELLEYLINEYQKYFQDLDESKLSPKFLLDACLNILIFMRNSDLYDKDELIVTVKNIFYIFMNKLYIMKAEKENINNN
jgi:hypothetical protein